MNATLLFVAVAVGAPALKDAPKKDSGIVGEWAVQSVNVGGKQGEPSSNRWAFNADGTFSIYSDGKALHSSPFVFDSKVSPCTLDILTANGGPPDHLCNFRIDGDTLTLSVGHDSKVRPAGVEPGGGATVWVMTRIKK
ncbi:MAG TPA: lipocalin family protein [Gemmataceae bacterium]|nr:lipocalin family protein [Gemmataceae bacterium]